VAEDIASQQAAMAEKTMQKANEQHQAHAYQQALAGFAERVRGSQQQEMER
jgi:hypothetical protein